MAIVYEDLLNCHTCAAGNNYSGQLDYGGPITFGKPLGVLWIMGGQF